MLNTSSLKSNLINTFLLSTALIMHEATPAYAQDENTVTTNTANKILPRRDSRAVIDTTERDIRIHPEDGTGPGQVGALYFHRPLFALEQNPNNNFEHPIIWGKREVNGDVLLRLRLVLSSPE